MRIKKTSPQLLLQPAPGTLLSRCPVIALPGPGQLTAVCAVQSVPSIPLVLPRLTPQTGPTESESDLPRREATWRGLGGSQHCQGLDCLAGPGRAQTPPRTVPRPSTLFSGDAQEGREGGSMPAGPRCPCWSRRCLTPHRGAVVSDQATSAAPCSPWDPSREQEVSATTPQLSAERASSVRVTHFTVALSACLHMCGGTQSRAVQPQACPGPWLPPGAPSVADGLGAGLPLPSLSLCPALSQQGDVRGASALL